MVKLVFLMRRKTGLSHEAFCDYWLNEHAKLIRRHAAELKIRRYVQSHAIAPEAVAAFRAEWDNRDPWDGVAEVWLDDLATVIASRASPQMQALQALLVADEASFVDLDRSVMIITEEHEVIAA